MLRLIPHWRLQVWALSSSVALSSYVDFSLLTHCQCHVLKINGKMVKSFRYYRALESVSIASALSTALTVYRCQIRVHQRWQSNSNFMQLRRRSGGRPQRAVHPMRLPVNTVIHTTLVGLEPATFRSLVDCLSDVLPVVPPTHQSGTEAGNQRLLVVVLICWIILWDVRNFGHLWSLLDNIDCLHLRFQCNLNAGALTNLLTMFLPVCKALTEEILFHLGYWSVVKVE